MACVDTRLNRSVHLTFSAEENHSHRVLLEAVKHPSELVSKAGKQGDPAAAVCYGTVELALIRPGRKMLRTLPLNVDI